MMAGKSVIYVNFSPYDNTGRTLDFLIENYYFVGHFSFDHLRLKNNRRANLSVYVDGELAGRKNLSWLKTHPLLLFPSLPFVAMMMLAETLLYTYLIKKQIGTIDYYMTVNAFPASVGILLRKLGIVKKTVFWVWDYFPTNFPDWRMRLIRKLYLVFDKFALKYSDKVIYLNLFLKKSREDSRHIKTSLNFDIIPIGTITKTYRNKSENIIGHMGLIKESQGLDLLFNNLEFFFKKFPTYKIEIIGSGPEEEKYKKLASRYKNRILFHGFMEDADKIDSLIRRWKLGLATYTPTEWSEHYWGDPSKIKAYIANGVPVITTPVPEFAKEVEKEKAGIVINYNKKELFEAIHEISRKDTEYSRNAIILSRKFNYKRMYSKLLD